MPLNTKTDTAETPLYFVYDGDCPICNMAADLYRLRQSAGRFETIDARSERDHPILSEIATAGLDLDEGMVIKYQGKLHHGDMAFRLMAQLSEPKGWFNRLNKVLAATDKRSKISYPVVKGMRNLMIAALGVGKIHDMKKVLPVSDDPIFKSIFQGSWDELPPVMLKHYANRPFCDDVSIVEGELDVMCRWYLKPFLHLFNTVPPYTQNDVPVTVSFTSQPQNAGFGFERVFHFEGIPAVKFHSRMFHRGGSEIMELMQFGICWHSNYSWDGTNVTLTHKGYSLRIGQRNLKLPITWLIGRGDAIETPIDDNSFSMGVMLTHPILGKIYSYEGTFSVVKEV